MCQGLEADFFHEYLIFAFLMEVQPSTRSRDVPFIIIYVFKPLFFAGKIVRIQTPFSVGKNLRFIFKHCARLNEGSPRLGQGIW